MTRPFRVVRGEVRVDVPDEVFEVLSQLPEMLDAVDDDDPAAARLTPVAHRDDGAAEAQFRSLTMQELERSRSSDRSAFRDGLELVRRGGALQLDQADGWLRVIGEARLVLGARLGIEEDGWEGADPAGNPSLALLGYLGFLQEELVVTIGILMFGES